MQNNAEHSKAKRSKAKQGNAKQSNAKQRNAKRSKAMQSNAKQVLLKRKDTPNWARAGFMFFFKVGLPRPNKGIPTPCYGLAEWKEQGAAAFSCGQ